MFSTEEEQELRKLLSDAVKKGVDTAKLHERSYMEMFREILRASSESTSLWHDTYLFRLIRHKSIHGVTKIHCLKVFDCDMYILVGAGVDVLEFYYPNNDLFASSTDKLTALSNGSDGYGISFPSYTFFEEKSDYFNFTVHNRVLPVEFEFFEIMRELHLKYVKN